MPASRHADRAALRSKLGSCSTCTRPHSAAERSDERNAAYPAGSSLTSAYRWRQTDCSPRSSYTAMSGDAQSLSARFQSASLGRRTMVLARSSRRGKHFQPNVNAGGATTEARWSKLRSVTVSVSITIAVSNALASLNTRSFANEPRAHFDAHFGMGTGTESPSSTSTPSGDDDSQRSAAVERKPDTTKTTGRVVPAARSDTMARIASPS
mmetsp:Transcript_1281/g.3611  ORF Transcript_1281/g.3611 Transcript_1281/m.3611 type:complete len:210 (+) Transcript_1281:524-1153(+)